MAQKMNDVRALQDFLGTNKGRLARIEPAEFERSASCTLLQCFEHIEKLEERIARLEGAARSVGSPPNNEAADSNSPKQLLTPGR